MVHDRRVNGETLTLGVSGKVQDGNLVMYDKRTGSLWLQRTGEALEGRLQGTVLKELPQSQYDAGVRLDEWREKHPETKVLHCEHCLPTSPAGTRPQEPAPR